MAPRDAGSTGPGMEMALAIALLSMFSLGVGGWLWFITSGLGVVVDGRTLVGDGRSVFLRSALFGTAVSFGLWLGWVLIAYGLLQRATTSAISIERLLREAGLATAPLALGVLMVVPYLSFGIGIAVIGAWAMGMQTALERATGVRGMPVLVANALGFALWSGVLSLITAGGHTFAPGPFLAHTVWESVARLVSTSVR
jgi:hypothetical protein